MEKLSKDSPTVAHSLFLSKLLPILEFLVPLRKTGSKGHSSQARKRNLLWRKMTKVKNQMLTTTSQKKMTRLLRTKHCLESELKSLYTMQNRQAEDKVIKEMKDNPNIFFSYARSRQKTRAKVGPLLDPSSGSLNNDPSFTSKVLSDQYSSVFTQPRPEWDIPDLQQFFSVDRSAPTGRILTHFDLTPDHIEYACAPGPDGIPASLLKECRKELKQPLWYVE